MIGILSPFLPFLTNQACFHQTVKLSPIHTCSPPPRVTRGVSETLPFALYSPPFLSRFGCQFVTTLRVSPDHARRSSPIW